MISWTDGYPIWGIPNQALIPIFPEYTHSSLNILCESVLCSAKPPLPLFVTRVNCAHTCLCSATCATATQSAGETCLGTLSTTVRHIPTVHLYLHVTIGMLVVQMENDITDLNVWADRHRRSMPSYSKINRNS